MAARRAGDHFSGGVVARGTRRRPPRATVSTATDGQAEEFLVREHELSPEWRDAATLTGGVYATPDEVEELARRVGELLRPYERPLRPGP